MSRTAFAALGAAASAVGLVVAAAIPGSPGPALAALTSPAAHAHQAAAPAAVASSPPPAPPPPPPAPKNPVPVPVTPAVMGTGCQGKPEDPANALTVKNTPWGQNALGGFSSVWQLSRGAHVTVAVVDSGVNYNAQLAGRVTAIDETGTGIQDCVGHGTAVAGIIAAADEIQNGNPFAGVAPLANILSVKVTNTGENNTTSDVAASSTATLAAGIRAAVNLGAQVINISIQTNGNDPLVASAVQFAESHNVVVVAASGNDEPLPNTSILDTGPYFPASYPGVISVGALSTNGLLASFSDQHSDTAVTAPGTEITSTEAGGYIVPGSGSTSDLQGTSFAAPYVSGLAALLRARFPSMTEAQIVARIEATADGNAGPGTGNGLVNPLQALQASMRLSANLNPPVQPPQRVSVPRAVPPDQGTINAAMGTTIGSLGGAALVAIAAMVVGHSRRRRRLAAQPAPAATGQPGDGGLNEGPLW